MDTAESLFARYLSERGYTSDFEPDLGMARRPDFDVRAGRHRVVTEVKSFDTWPRLSSIGARSQEEVLAPHRHKIREASAQLKPLAGQGAPLVVVLCNPRGCPVPLEPIEVMAAMYGDLTAWFPVYEDGDEHEVTGTIQAGRNGKLRHDHQYISAVAVLHNRDLAFGAWSERWGAEHRDDQRPTVELAAAFLDAAQGAPHSDDVFLHVFETVSDTATPLPRDIFDGPHDLRWVPDSDRTSLVPLGNAADHM